VLHAVGRKRNNGDTSCWAAELITPSFDQDASNKTTGVVAEEAIGFGKKGDKNGR
jgi:hypothetical protein